MQQVALSPQAHQIITSYIARACGICLGPEKGYLLEQRLGGLLASLHCQDYEELSRLLLTPQGQNAEIRNTIVTAITTHETSFFRDSAPFQLFETILRPQRAGGLRVWSAACSTGQEPYSLAITILESARLHPGLGIDIANVHILATDISPVALEKARQGSYPFMDIVRGLSPELRERYFTPEKNGQWKVNDSVRKLVDFRPLNLMEDFTRLGSFDVIFCRNVLIYFSEESKQKILAHMQSMLPAHGALILGAAENLYNMRIGLESVHTLHGPYYRPEAKR